MLGIHCLNDCPEESKAEKQPSDDPGALSVQVWDLLQQGVIPKLAQEIIPILAENQESARTGQRLNFAGFKIQESVDSLAPVALTGRIRQDEFSSVTIDSSDDRSNHLSTELVFDSTDLYQNLQTDKVSASDLQQTQEDSCAKQDAAEKENNPVPAAANPTTIRSKAPGSTSSTCPASTTNQKETFEITS